MKKNYNKLLISYWSVVIVLVIFLVIFISYLTVKSSVLPIGTSGYADGDLKYTDGNLILDFTSQDGNPRIDPLTCSEVGILDQCRGILKGNSLKISNLGQAECISLGASWEKQSSARGCDNYACYLGGLDLSEYTITNENHSDNIIFDFGNFKETGKPTICNKNEVGTINSAHLIITFSLDTIERFYRLINNSCSQVDIKMSEKTDLDFVTIQDCNSHINIPTFTCWALNEKKTECGSVELLNSCDNISEFDLEKDCKAKIKDNKLMFLPIGILFILIITGIILTFILKFSKRGNRK